MNRSARLRGSLASAALAATLALGGCATMAPQPGGQSPPLATDPWEAFNRRVFAFNDAVDTAVMKPVAQAWQQVVPQPVRAGIGRVFANFADVWSGINMLLQGRVQHALETGMRFGINTVFGVFGVFDVAETVGLDRLAPEDLGQTLGRWGVPPGPYLVLPILGPSSVRDGAALPADLHYSSPTLLVDRTTQQVAVTGVQLIDTRARLLGAGKVLDEIALDRYVFLRDAYLARRRNQVYDGNPPEEEEPSPPDAAASAPGDPAPAASAPAVSPSAAASSAPGPAPGPAKPPPEPASAPASSAR